MTKKQQSQYIAHSFKILEEESKKAKNKQRSQEEK